MKIAYLLSGFARCYKDTSPLLHRNVINLLRLKGRVDVFVSTWEKTDRGGYQEWRVNPQKELLDSYPLLKDSEVEKNWSYHNRYVSDFYRRWRAWVLMEKEEEKTGEKYDVVIRDRIDSVHVRFFPVVEILNLDNKVSFPAFVGDFGFRPFQDWFAFGTREAMFDYYNIYNLIKDMDYESNIVDLIGEKMDRYYPEQVLYAGLKSVDRETKFSTYEFQPYDRHFGQKVHQEEIYQDENGKYRLNTRRYGGSDSGIEEREPYILKGKE